jgi:hypothetical protein
MVLESMMNANPTGKARWGVMLGAAVAAIAGLGIATPASAHGWHGGWGGGPSISFGFGYPYASGYPYGYGYGYAYAPPVYYSAPTTYYYPPTTYYSQSSVTTSAVHHKVRHHVHHTAQAPSCPLPQSGSGPAESQNSVY